MWAGFRTLLNLLRFRELPKVHPVKVKYALEISVPGEKMLIGTNSMAVFLMVQEVIRHTGSIDERLQAARASVLENFTIPARYAARFAGSDLYAYVGGA